MSRTLFVISNPYTSPDLQTRVRSLLPDSQIGAIRHVASVTHARDFGQLRVWRPDPSGRPVLHLDRLTVVLQRSSYWYYLVDHNTALVESLARLDGIRELAFARNGAPVKGSLLAWYNRLAGRMMARDRADYLAGRTPGRSFWAWSLLEGVQLVRLRRRHAREMPASATDYVSSMGPALARELEISTSAEVWDPDPMSRV